MATCDRRLDKDGKDVYRARVRRKGYTPQVATLRKLSDAKKWVQITEAAMLEGRHFKTREAKSHTLADLLKRYIRDILPQKSASTPMSAFSAEGRPLYHPDQGSRQYAFSRMLKRSRPSHVFSIQCLSIRTA